MIIVILPHRQRRNATNCSTLVVIMLSSIPADRVVFLRTQGDVTLLRASERLLSASRSGVKCCKQYALTASTARLRRRHAPTTVPSPQLFVIDKGPCNSPLTLPHNPVSPYISLGARANKRAVNNPLPRFPHRPSIRWTSVHYAVLESSELN